MVRAVLLHCDGSFEGSVPNGQTDAICCSFLDELGGLVSSVACNHFTVDLGRGMGKVNSNTQNGVRDFFIRGCRAKEGGK